MVGRRFLWSLNPTQVPGKCISPGQTHCERQRRAGPTAKPPGKLENAPDQSTTAGRSSPCHIFPCPIFVRLFKKIFKDRKKKKSNEGDAVWCTGRLQPG